MGTSNGVGEPVQQSTTPVLPFALLTEDVERKERGSIARPVVDCSESWPSVKPVPVMVNTSGPKNGLAPAVATDVVEAVLEVTETVLVGWIRDWQYWCAELITSNSAALAPKLNVIGLVLRRVKGERGQSVQASNKAIAVERRDRDFNGVAAALSR